MPDLPVHGARGTSRVDDTLAALVRRDRAVTAAGLAALTLAGWLYLLHEAGALPGMAGMPGMRMAPPWDLVDLALAFAMWTIMMVAMMLPSAAPMTLLFARVNRTRRAAAGSAAGDDPAARPAVSTAVFVAGYLLVWTAFSALAALGQWVLQALALLSPHTLQVGPVLAGALLMAAGLYQMTPLKYACLARCQTPLGFLVTEWREGRRGALVMGLRHGAHCAGCCWLLMALLFAAGVMHLGWVAAIAAFVLLEKLLPAGRVAPLVTGGVLLAWGIAVIARTL
jgi:predicted metal-binding membrane protein